MDSLRVEESLKVKRKRNVYKFIKTFDSLVDIDTWKPSNGPAILGMSMR